MADRNSAGDKQPQRNSGGSSRRGNGGKRKKGSNARRSFKTSNKPKFEGNCPELKGYYFDCSSHRQTDAFAHLLKRIEEYVGTNYKQPGDIRSTIEKEVKYLIPKSEDIDMTTASEVEKAIFKEEIKAYVHRKQLLEENMKKGYSLVLGQCTDLMKTKLESSKKWEAMSTDYDLLALIDEIRKIIFKFKEQQYPPAAEYTAKKNFYTFSQGNLSNTEYQV